ncbi:MAG: PIN domain-containing protein [Pseudanabaenales cyanobacterium]|nr:PIN domain-containing protein [Pseudanabaenales cyanobacterium]
MRVLLDTNIILDFFLEREPFFNHASKLFDAIADRKIEGFITASSITDIFYICRRQTQNFEEARQILETTLALLSICPVDRDILETALKSSLADFEDAVQIACAEAQSLEVIITRNSQDFQTANIPVMSASQLREQLKD